MRTSRQIAAALDASINADEVYNHAWESRLASQVQGSEAQAAQIRAADPEARLRAEVERNRRDNLREMGFRY